MTNKKIRGGSLIARAIRDKGIDKVFTLSGGLDSSSLLKTALDLKTEKYRAFSIKSNFKDENDEREGSFNIGISYRF